VLIVLAEEKVDDCGTELVRIRWASMPMSARSVEQTTIVDRQRRSFGLTAQR
jgi:hypothetical protein